MVQPKRMSTPAQLFLGAFVGFCAAGVLAWGITTFDYGVRQILDGLPLIAILVGFILLAITAIRCVFVRYYFPIVLCLLYIAGIGFTVFLYENSGAEDNAVVTNLLPILPWAFFGLCFLSTVMSFMTARQPATDVSG
ncbi:membrane hypothetical protein [Paraburkholderia tropica]|uniref:hypothetical protein n=1 Tax=Paraburkholderia tropica TaxID=92647 RepID=UPI001CAAC3F5|nr:hypothetical protein [Paraburkholderia tropica]CAG9230164.1 membrane hypothetical protein [Paraburkholderia tropica]